MSISRRDFLRYCTSSAAVLGLGTMELESMAGTLAGPSAPSVLWLQGACCSGCSVSFLNHISGTAPHNAGEVLIDVINLAYHPTLMAPAGGSAVAAAAPVYSAGDYLLVVEGGVPTAFDGCACWAFSVNGKEWTFHDVVRLLAKKADAVVCVGECSSFGGVWAAPPNPGGVKPVSEVIGKQTINVAGCPPHPDWLVWVIATYLAGTPIQLDAHGRPTYIYNNEVHHRCPLRGTPYATRWGQQDWCKENIGCRGKFTAAPCPDQFFNGGTNWCIGAGAPCIGCTSPGYPGTASFFEKYTG
jgi:hydrogenase small subunit